MTSRAKKVGGWVLGVALCAVGVLLWYVLIYETVAGRQKIQKSLTQQQEIRQQLEQDTKILRERAERQKNAEAVRKEQSSTK